MKHVLVALSCILLSACSTMSEKAAMVKEADKGMIKELNCKFLGNVSVTTDTRGQSFASGINSAKILAREDAADKGASHILWTSALRGFVTTVEGEAYFCNKANSSK